MHCEAKPLGSRFWSKVQVDQQTDCWAWTAGKTKRGYGIYSQGRKTLLAHKASYEYMRTEVPAGLVLDHLCRNTSCVNPYHLDPVTQRVNVERSSAWDFQKNKTHCPHGHEYTIENTYIVQRPKRNGVERICRSCTRARQNNPKVQATT